MILIFLDITQIFDAFSPEFWSMKQACHNLGISSKNSRKTTHARNQTSFLVRNIIPQVHNHFHMKQKLFCRYTVLLLVNIPYTLLVLCRESLGESSEALLVLLWPHIDGAHLGTEHQASLPTCLPLFRQARHQTLKLLQP